MNNNQESKIQNIGCSTLFLGVAIGGLLWANIASEGRFFHGADIWLGVSVILLLLGTILYFAGGASKKNAASKDNSTPIPWMENFAALKTDIGSRGDSHPEVVRFKAAVCTVISQVGTNTSSSAIAFVDQYFAQLKQANPTGYSRIIEDLKEGRNEEEHMRGVIKQFIASRR